MNCPDTNCSCEIKEYCPPCPEDISYYTEIILNGEIKIPCNKPCSEKAIQLYRKICITKAEALRVHLDNGCISGCKVLVTGTLQLGIEYSADVPEQNVHFMHADIPFQGLLMGGPCNQPIPLCDCDLKKFHLHICVEHIQIHQINPRCFEKVIVLMLWLERKHHLPPHHCQSEPTSYNNPPETCPPPPCAPEPCLPQHCTPESCPPDVCKEISINHILTIPCAEPPVECILHSFAEIEITNAFVIKTPLVSGPCCIPVRKVVITGKAHITVKYAADVPDQQVHAAEFCIPFKSLMEWPGGPPPGTPICIDVIEEHFQVDKLEPCNLFAAMIIRIDVYQN